MAGFGVGAGGPCELNSKLRKLGEPHSPLTKLVSSPRTVGLAPRGIHFLLITECRWSCLRGRWVAAKVLPDCVAPDAWSL
jgi:hypothetical protein